MIHAMTTDMADTHPAIRTMDITDILHQEIQITEMADFLLIKHLTLNNNTANIQRTINKQHTDNIPSTMYMEMVDTTRKRRKREAMASSMANLGCR